MSRKNNPFSYGEPGGPCMVAIHSWRLSCFGPALQFGRGSLVISPNSFCSRLDEVFMEGEDLVPGLELFDISVLWLDSPNPDIVKQINLKQVMK